MRILAVVAGATLISLVFASGALAGDDRYRDGAVKEQWEALLANDCAVETAEIATPIEARVLRNTPYAIAGKKFKSAELTELFSSDGDWYKPTTKNPKLSSKAKRCVGKLKKWEAKLRKQLPLKKKIEAFMTRDRRLYLDLRISVPYDAAYYTPKGGSVSDGTYSWGFSYSKKCYKMDDCGGYSIMCELEKKKVTCMLVAAG